MPSEPLRSEAALATRSCAYPPCSREFEPRRVDQHYCPFRPFGTPCRHLDQQRRLRERTHICRCGKPHRVRKTPAKPRVRHKRICAPDCPCKTGGSDDRGKGEGQPSSEG